MKEVLKLTVISLSSLAVFGTASAADQKATTANQGSYTSSASSDNREVQQDIAGVDKKVSPNLNRASKVIGTNVADASGKKIGDIKDVVLDRNTGQVAYAVVSFGGVLGVGDKYFAVPWTALKPAQNDRYVLNVSKDQLKRAQGFDKDRWPDMASEQWNRENARAFNEAPYWEQGSTASRRSSATSGSSGASSQSGASDSK